MGSSPSPPPAPDYAKANREGIKTDIETLPIRRQIDRAAQMGTAGTYQLDGQSYSYDFTGMSDLDFARQQRDLARETADLTAQDLLSIQQDYGQQYLETSREQLKASDPIGFAIRENMGKQLNRELALGGAASDDELRQVQQRVRGQQSRLGNTMGVAAGVQEVMGQAGYQQQRQQQPQPRQQQQQQQQQKQPQQQHTFAHTVTRNNTFKCGFPSTISIITTTTCERLRK